MQCLALRAFLSGLENVGVVDFRRDVRFDRFFKYNAYPKVVSFFVTIALAWYWRNYWALVAGILVLQATRIALSYGMHSYRPRFSLKKISGLWSFSTWTLLRSIGISLNAQIDQIVIGGITSVSSMGRYSVASDVAATPSREINDPIVTVLYSVMAKVQRNLEEMRSVYLRVFAWSATICISASVGMALVAGEMVPLVLGSRWLDVEPLMGWLALSAGMLGINSAPYVLFDVLGRPHVGARMQWVRLVLLVIAIVPVGYMTRNLEWIAATRLIVTAIFTPPLLFAAGRQAGVSTMQYVQCLWRPALSAVAMSALVLSMDTILPTEVTLRLLIKTVIGAAAFSGSSLLLWYLSGRPPAPERDVMEYLLKLKDRLMFAGQPS
jgi:O-antigen/teichoic acid export membrane protein